MDSRNGIVIMQEPSLNYNPSGGLSWSILEKWKCILFDSLCSSSQMRGVKALDYIVATVMGNLISVSI